MAFEAAWKHDANPRALLNLGIARERSGRLDDALAAFDEYLRQADPVRDVKNLGAVRTEAARLRRASTRLLLRASPAHAQLSIDGRVVTLRDGQARVFAGVRRIAVSAEGHVPYAQTVTLPSGEVTLQLTLREALGLPTPATSAAPSQPASQRPQPPQPTAAREAKPDGKRCALGEICLGPVLSLGLPNAFGGGFHIRVGDYFGAGVDFQVLPSITLDPATASASLFSVTARIHPFGGALFLAGGLGYQAIQGRVDNGLIAAEASVDVPAFFAGIGFLGRDGLVLGVDIGVLVPLRGQSVVVRDLSGAPMGVEPADVERVRSQAQDGVNEVLDLLPVLLQLNVLRIGYLF